MNKSECFQKLSSKNTHERLRAARFLSQCITKKDRDTVKELLDNENVSWIKSALRKALEKTIGEAREVKEIFEYKESEGDPSSLEDVYAEATEEITRRLIHEIEPILGACRHYALQEIEKYENSKTKGQLERLGGHFSL